MTYIPVKIKEAVIERAKDRCEYCQCWRHNASHTFNIEHILPLSKNGQTILSNLALSCSGCNGAKSDKTEAIDPLTRKKIPLYNPRKYKWNEHFFWSEDSLKVIGLTPTGRASVDLLRLNRIGV